MKARRVLWLLPAILLVYTLWLVFQILSFRTYGARPQPPGQEVEGCYHVHSKFSDGRSDVASIVRAAADAGLRFLILTDHGNPNLPSLQSQGWRSGVLVLAGSELSVSRGHLVALDFSPPPQPFAQNAEAAMREVRAQGGFTVIAHPYSKTQWTWGRAVDFDGLEIVNGDTALRTRFFRSLPYLPALLIRPELAILRMLDSPATNLAKWDELNAEQTLFGIFSADAHAFYGPLFRSLRLHLVLPERLSEDFGTARKQVFDALRKGRFYSAMDSAAAARGFRFWAEREGRVFGMGRVLSSGPAVTLRIRAPFAFAKESRLIRDGKAVAAFKENRNAVQVTEPGVYRVEVYLRARTPLAGDVPWIVSNPIFVREDTHDEL